MSEFTLDADSLVFYCCLHHHNTHYNVLVIVCKCMINAFPSLNSIIIFTELIFMSFQQITEQNLAKLNENFEFVYMCDIECGAFRDHI
jgi:hypothetical protein